MAIVVNIFITILELESFYFHNLITINHHLLPIYMKTSTDKTKADKESRP